MRGSGGIYKLSPLGVYRDEMHMDSARSTVRKFVSPVSHFAALLSLIAAGALAAAGKPSTKLQNQDLPAQVISFIRDKERYLRALSQEYKLEFPAELSDFFAVAKKGDGTVADALYTALRDQY